MINSFLKQTAEYVHSARSNISVHLLQYAEKRYISNIMCGKISEMICSASQYEISILKIPSGISHHRRCEESLSYVR